MNVKIGAKIKELRKRDDITQEQLAEVLGVTNQAISKWESENGYPDIEYITPIARFFNVTTDYLFDNIQQSSFKILIFDDWQISMDALCAILQSEYQIIIAESGQVLLESAMNEQPDLILMDIFMSGICNFEVLSSLKASELTRAIPVIIVSAYSAEETGVKCFNLGAADYIEKPISAAVLKARVAAQLRNVRQTHR